MINEVIAASSGAAVAALIGAGAVGVDRWRRGSGAPAARVSPGVTAGDVYAVVCAIRSDVALVRSEVEQLLAAYDVQVTPQRVEMMIDAALQELAPATTEADVTAPVVDDDTDVIYLGMLDEYPDPFPERAPTR